MYVSLESALNVLQIPFLVLLLMPVYAATAAELVTQLTVGNIEQLQPQGPDAIGGIDDWLISYGTLCAVVSDPALESGLLAWGGALVDVYHSNRGNDQWSFHHVIPNIDKDLPFNPTRIRPYDSNGQSGVSVEFSGLGLHLRSTYRFVSGSKTQMRVEHSPSRRAEGSALTMLGILALHPNASLAPFSLSTRYPEYSLVFSPLHSPTLFILMPIKTGSGLLQV